MAADDHVSDTASDATQLDRSWFRGHADFGTEISWNGRSDVPLKDRFTLVLLTLHYKFQIQHYDLEF